MILFVHLLNDRSGSPNVLSKVIRNVPSNSSSRKLLTSRSEDGFLVEFHNETIFVNYRHSRYKFLVLFNYLKSQFFIFYKCFFYLKKKKSTVYVNTLLPFGAALAGKLVGSRVIYHIHETYVTPYLLKKFLRYIVSKTASDIVYVSHYLSNAEPFPGIESRVIYNAIEDQDRRASVRTLDKNQKFIVLMVCSLKAFKGVYEFVALAKLCPDQLFELVVNADQAEINHFFVSCALPKNLMIYPRQIHLEGFYIRSNLVVNLSCPDVCVETFGLTLLESMSYGVPVIAPPVGGPAEIVRNGVEGYLISCYELDKLSATIYDLAKNVDLYEKLSFNALARVQDFSLEKFNNEIKKLIDI